MKVACITLLILALTVCAVLCDKGAVVASAGKAAPPNPAPTAAKQKSKGNDDTSTSPVDLVNVPIPHSEIPPSESTKTFQSANDSGAVVQNTGASENITTPVPTTPTNKTTTAPTVPTVPTTITTKTPPTTAPPKPTPDPHTTTPTPSTTTIHPNATTLSPNTTTFKPTPTTPSISTTAIPSTTQHPPSRHFDGLSFLGGIILATCLMAVGAFLWKFSRTCSEGNYRTL